MLSSFKRPESILVVVATEANEILLLRRRDPPGYWQSVTGSLEWGESAPAAAKRELREETGLADADPEDTGITNAFEIVPPWTEKFAPGTTTNREHVYLLRLRDRPAVELDAREHVEYRWVPARDGAVLASSATDRAAIARLLKS